MVLKELILKTIFKINKIRIVVLIYLPIKSLKHVDLF